MGRPGQTTRDVGQLATAREVVQRDLREIAARLGPIVGRLAGKTVLITGAAGMLASYIVEVIATLNDSGALAAPARLLLNVRSIDSNSGRIAYLAGPKDTRFLVQDARE